MTFDAAAILGAVRRATGSEGTLALHEPHLAGNERRYVQECIDSGWVSSVGSFVDRFERELSTYTGAPHAVAVTNGTAALHLALLAAGVRAGDEVLLPALTFIATANATHYCGAVPHFVDIDRETLGISPTALAEHLGAVGEYRDDGLYNRETGRRLGAIVCVHAFGHPAAIEPLCELAGHYRLPLVEDAAESLGTLYCERHTGTFGRLAALSFNGNKIITTGGGGAVLTNDPSLAERVRHLSTTAKEPHPWRYRHDAVGFNYRMPNINAALGCAQLERIEHYITRKRDLNTRYMEAMAEVAGVSVFKEPQGARSNHWLNVLLLDPELAGQRDALLEEMHRAGILARPVWELLHKQQVYRECPRASLEVSEAIEQQLICLPSSVFLGERGHA